MQTASFRRIQGDCNFKRICPLFSPKKCGSLWNLSIFSKFELLGCNRASKDETSLKSTGFFERSFIHIVHVYIMKRCTCDTSACIYYETVYLWHKCMYILWNGVPVTQVHVYIMKRCTCDTSMYILWNGVPVTQACIYYETVYLWRRLWRTANRTFHFDFSRSMWDFCFEVRLPLYIPRNSIYFLPPKTGTRCFFTPPFLGSSHGAAYYEIL